MVKKKTKQNKNVMKYPHYLGVKREVRLALGTDCRGGTFPIKTRPLICDRLSANTTSFNCLCADHIQARFLRRPPSSPIQRAERGAVCLLLDRQHPPLTEKKKKEKGGERQDDERRETPVFLTER